MDDVRWVPCQPFELDDLRTDLTTNAGAKIADSTDTLLIEACGPKNKVHALLLAVNIDDDDGTAMDLATGRMQEILQLNVIRDRLLDFVTVVVMVRDRVKWAKVSAALNQDLQWHLSQPTEEIDEKADLAEALSTIAM